MDLSEKALWQAVLKRDRRYNGICFYGVMSTFIYCRFQCPSKKPLPENTRFFFSQKGARKSWIQTMQALPSGRSRGARN